MNNVVNNFIDSFWSNEYNNMFLLCGDAIVKHK